MKQNKLKEGLIQVYTGNGKGKTTAALGLALRAVGHNLKVIIIQFMKGSKNYGEFKAIKKYLPQIKIEQFGLTTFVNKNNPSKKDIELAQKGLKRARRAILSRVYDLVILDEINVTMDFNLISVEDVLQLIEEKPPNVELILTGRYVPEEIIEKADLVSEVKEIKHWFTKGVDTRKGIEY